MSLFAECAPFAVLGLLGSLHCIGMCGGLALIAGGGGGRGARLRRSLFYIAGKTSTYVVLGVGVALVLERARGTQTGDAAAGFGVRAVIAWLAGAGLVVVGLQSCGLLRGFAAPRWMTAPARGFRAALAHVRGLPPSTAAYSVGVLSGLLPCGLSWGAFLLASQLDPARASLGLVTFGLATAPALVATVVGVASAPRSVRTAGARLLGPALIVLGLYTAWRGGLPLEGAEAPPCCDPGQTVESSAPSSRVER